MKNPIYLFIFTLFVSLCILTSCKQKPLFPYAYNANKDTIPPVLSITVPVSLMSYVYGEDIHVVGTVMDLQERDKNGMKSGKLKSLYLNISIIDPVPDTVLKVLMLKTPAVDGKDGFTINEKTSLNFGVGTTTCRFTGVATDYADRKDSTVFNFTIH